MPNTTVGAIILSGEGQNEKILLTRRNIPPFRGQWCLPGGHVDKFEKLSNAVVREVREETGLQFSGEYFNWFEEIYPDINVHNVVMIFVGKAGGDISAQESEVRDIQWFTKNEAKNLDLAFCHNQVIDALG